MEMTKAEKYRKVAGIAASGFFLFQGFSLLFSEHEPQKQTPVRSVK